VGVHNTEYSVNLDGEDGQPAISSAASDRPGNGNVNGSGSVGHISGSEIGDSASDVTSPLHRLPMHRRMSLTRTNNVSQSKITEYKTSRALHVSKIIGPVSYYVGIIDYQQKWTWSKKVRII
jgi:hypothetical protein